MSQREGGFTIIEVLVAVVILGFGIVALVGSSGVVTRMIGQGKRTTNAASVSAVNSARGIPVAAIACSMAGADPSISTSWFISG